MPLPIEDFSALKNAGPAVGKDTHVRFKLQIRYDNALIQVGRTDSSGVRAYLTPDPRYNEINGLDIYEYCIRQNTRKEQAQYFK